MFFSFNYKSCAFGLCSLLSLMLFSDATDYGVEELQVKPIWKPSVCKRSVKIGDYVHYHYYGMLTNGKYFDSSYERGVSYNTYVGSGWLIDGMDKGLIGMCVNEHRLITIPPHLAYGEEGTGEGLIPGNATIIFNAVLLDIWNANDSIEVTTTFMPENCSKKIKTSDYVRYHYNGTLLNGKHFHSSYEEDSTYNTYVGQGWLIKGMDEGLIGACIGERMNIVIPPHLAYGEKGDEKNIPPSATVVFDVEIVDFHNPNDDVVVEILKPVENCPRKLENTDFVRYHYNGTLSDGTVFDNSYQRGHTYDTYVGYKRLIPGMERGLIGACMGEWRLITFPPHLGYGERGVEDKIPGSAVLTFSVHIIDFHNPKDDVQIEVMTLPENCKEEGARISKTGDYLTYDYDLLLMDGTKIESSKDRTGNWGSYIGTGRVIPGVSRGLSGMCVGEIRRVVIPPHIAYGEPGKDDFIPGSAVLDFTFELHNIEDPLPDGMHFVWVDDEHTPESEEDLFHEMDEDKDGFIILPEFTSYLLNQVEAGYAKLEPGNPQEDVITELFRDQDKNEDERIDRQEFTFLADDEPPQSKIEDEL
ncbi:peptidyl-prolyl cis-trans isomerase FKBP10-like [Clavelina lepadiformis]|uniref:peptidyl-prolyl cis-trans isomerase FKBP10-like n=1 Tax=Clavelina lepadiformis TaxID=159417 RepID=UPI0040416F85